MAESGLLFQRFAENLTAALRPEADIRLILVKRAANDPKRTSAIRAIRSDTQRIHRQIDRFASDNDIMKFEVKWQRLIGESLVIIVSILIAFAIDASWDKYQENLTETAYLQNLLVEMREARDELRGDDERRRTLLHVIESLQKESESRSVPDTTVMEWVNGLMRDPAFFPPGAVFQDLLNAGNLQVIKSDELRFALNSYNQDHPRLRFVEENTQMLTDTRIEPYVSERISLASPEPEDLSTLLSSQYFGNLLIEKQNRVNSVLFWSARVERSIDRIIDILEREPRAVPGDP